MKYLLLDENNKVTAGLIKGIHEIPNNAVEVNEEIWKQRLNDSSLNCYENGKLIVKDFRTDDEIEKARVQDINSYTQSIITKKYPLEKQSSANLGIYGEDYKNEMTSFISNCIALSNEAIANNTSFEDFKAMLNEY